MPRGRLDRDRTADTVVVGGGMAGLMCALRLAHAGQSVVLLERDVCGGGATGRSSGFVTPDSELELNQLVERRGDETAKRLWDLVNSGVEAIRESVERFQIPCDLREQDSLFIATSRSGVRAVTAEHDTRSRFGYASRLYRKHEVAEVIGSQAFHGAVRYPGTFAINSFRFCRAMRDVLEAQGVLVCEATEATAIESGAVRAGPHTVRARSIAVCTDHDLPPPCAAVSAAVYPIQTFLAVTEPLPDADVARLFPDGPVMMWDTDLIYQYLRLTSDSRLLMGAGSMLETYSRARRATPLRVLRKMRAYLNTQFPWLAADFVCTWPGLIGVSRDFVPLSESDAPQQGVGYVTAAAGLPWAAALGQRLANVLLGDQAGPDPLLSPSRLADLGLVRRIVGKPAVFAASHAWMKHIR